MMIVIHWPYRWLCRIGLHEYYIGTKKPINAHDEDEPLQWDDEYECDICGKKKPRVP